MASPLFAREQGRGEKTLVLLHGFGDTHGAWSDVQRELALDCHTIAFDLPGHGNSMAVDGAGSSRKTALEVISELRRRNLGAVHLAGHSMGGAVGVLLALSAPELILSITLLAPGGFGPEINQRLLRRYAEASDAASIRFALENMFGWNNAVSSEIVERHCAMRAVTGQREILMRIADGFGRNGIQKTIARDSLERLSMPVKVLWGTQDRVLPTRQAHRLPPLFAAHIFENAGHMLAAEAPAEVAKLIRQNMR